MHKESQQATYSGTGLFSRLFLDYFIQPSYPLDEVSTTTCTLQMKNGDTSHRLGSAGAEIHGRISNHGRLTSPLWLLFKCTVHEKLVRVNTMSSKKAATL